MSEIVDRATAAFFEEFNNPPSGKPRNYHAAMRAAIAAMRLPTEAMLPSNPHRPLAILLWVGMIEEALKD